MRRRRTSFSVVQRRRERESGESGLGVDSAEMVVGVRRVCTDEDFTREREREREREILK
jgi:hypothetical protein